MKAHKRAPYILAVPLFIVASIITQFTGIGVGTASAATLTWDGSAGDGLFSNGANWNTGNAPVNGDVLSFNLTGVGSSPVYTNDISNLSVAGINASGTPSAYAAPTIEGNTLTLTGNISNTVVYSGYGIGLGIDTGVTLGSNVTVTGPVEFGGTGKTTNIGVHNLTFANTESSCPAPVGALGGSGAVILNGGEGTQFALNAASSTFTGTIDVTGGILFVTAPANLGNTNLLTLSGSGHLNLFSDGDTTWTTPLSLGGTGTLSAQHSGSGCGGGSVAEKYTATVTAPVTLTSDFVYIGHDNLTITGTYNANNHAFTVQNGSTGTLTTPNGTSSAPVIEVLLEGDDPNENSNVGFNETATLTGIRGYVTVNNGGVLKGTGTVQSLYLYNGGIVAPGNSPGTLTSLETYTQDASTYRAEILNATSYDKIVVGADYTGSGSAVSLGAGALLQTILYDGWSINAGDTFTIIDNLSSTPVSGTFDGLAEGAELVVDGVRFTISYVGGDGNDVVLTAVTGGVYAPNTGMQKLIMGNPAIVAGLGITAAAAVAFVALRRKSNR